MYCEFESCIYNRECNCLIDEPEINSLGMCNDAIVVSLDSDFLEKEKKIQLAQLEVRWADRHPKDL